MSQWTANEMAKEGSTSEEILNFFFEGTTIIQRFRRQNCSEKKLSEITDILSKIRIT